MPGPGPDERNRFEPVAGALKLLTNRDIGAIRFNVVSITGVEAINELFHFEAVLTAPREEVAQYTSPHTIHELLLRQEVVLSLGDGVREVEESPTRRFAMIKAAHHDGFVRSGDHEVLRLRLELVPGMWLLTQRRNSRIFQDMYVHEIVSTVLHENDICHRWTLVKRYPRRLYCTQYEETDYDFVTRLLAEEGILFYFRHDDRRFYGGEPAKYEVQKSSEEQTLADLSTGLQVAGGIAQGLAGAAGMLGGMAGSDDAQGWGTVLGSGAGMIGDLGKALAGLDEAPMTEGVLDGQAGPDVGRDVFVFVDNAAYLEAENEHGETLRLSLEEAMGMVAYDAHTLESSSSVRRTAPELVEIRDYDFRKPLLLLKENAGEGPPPEPAPEEGDARPPAGRLMEQYEHHGEYETPDIDRETAEIRLEQHRRDTAAVDGKTRSPFLRPGYFFELWDRETGERRQLVVTRVRHELCSQAPVAVEGDDAQRIEAIVKACARAIHQAARAPALGEEQLRDVLRGVIATPPEGSIVYQNFFDSVAAQVAYRPPRPPRVIRNVTESATVMGPVGQDIYTDRFGRVKVQFHWDRQGQLDAHTSVWMRVVQPWAGAGYGFQFFPRVGMEVLVTFLGGDTDRPIVVGSLYNGTHATPEPLPERLTRSGIRTQSTPKGGGFNELSFDDKKGTERVYLHAERDFVAEINHTHGMKVKHDHTLEVGMRQHIGVEGEQLVAVGGMQATNVGQDQACCVAGSRRDRVVGHVSARVEGSSVEEVRGVAVRTVDTDELTLVKGHRDVSVYGSAALIVGGTGEQTRASATVSGTASLVADKIRIIANEELTIRCGDSGIRVKPDKIMLQADRVAVLGRDEAQIAGEEVLCFTPGGALMNLRASRTEVRGAEIHMTTPEASGGPLDPATHPENVKLRFTHLALEHSEPIANTEFILTVPPDSSHANSLYGGTTNGDGELSFHAPDGVETVELVLYANKTYSDIYPEEGGPLRFIVHLVDALAEADAPKGARMRLCNLGYQPGTDFDEEDIEPATRQALLDFQLEVDLPRTGALDDRTKRKLRETYGS